MKQSEVIIFLSTIAIMFGVSVFVDCIQWLDWYYQEDLLVKFGGHTWNEAAKERLVGEKLSQICGANIAIAGAVFLAIGLIRYNKELGATK
ncbi:MAG: hypothetical protein ACFE7I_09830 [Candidatus Hodarchaeota archaeon]